MSRRLPKTTKEQFAELLDFVERNKILLHRKLPASKAAYVDRLWQEFAVKVNAKQLGSLKTPKQWRKVFNEWKVNTKRKIRTNSGGDSLTHLQERLLKLLMKNEYPLAKLNTTIDIADTGILSTKNEVTNLRNTGIINFEAIISDDDNPSQIIQFPSIKQDILRLEEEMENVSNKPQQQDNSESREHQEHYIESYRVEPNSTANPQQSMLLDVQNLNAQALNNLASSINNLANAKKSEAEALHLLAKAKMLCAKAKYYKVCNKTIEEFEI